MLFFFSSHRLEAQKRFTKRKKDSRNWRTTIGLCGESPKRSPSHPAPLTQMMWTYELIHCNPCTSSEDELLWRLASRWGSSNAVPNWKKSLRCSTTAIKPSRWYQITCLHLQKMCPCVLSRQYYVFSGHQVQYISHDATTSLLFLAAEWSRELSPFLRDSVLRGLEMLSDIHDVPV